MTGQEFETYICERFRNSGFWTLNIPRNSAGAQPFDVLAIKGSEVWAVDCKVCSTPRLPLSRIEDNQWASFAMMQDRTNAHCAFMCYDETNKRVVLVPYEKAVEADKAGQASISLVKQGV